MASRGCSSTLVAESSNGLAYMERASPSSPRLFSSFPRACFRPKIATGESDVSERPERGVYALRAGENVEDSAEIEPVKVDQQTLKIQLPICVRCDLSNFFDKSFNGRVEFPEGVSRGWVAAKFALSDRKIEYLNHPYFRRHFMLTPPAEVGNAPLLPRW